MNLSDFFSLLTGRGPANPDAGPPEGAPPHASIILCNDATELHKNGEAIAKALRRQGHDIRIKCVSNERELLGALENMHKKGEAPPNAIFMDVGGVGERTARKVIKWYDKQYPKWPLPAMNFLSLSIDMGITEAGQLRGSDGRVKAGFVDPGELDWLQTYLTKGRKNNYPPISTTFRDVLNDKLGLNLPLDHDDANYRDRIKRMNDITNDRVLEAWQNGKLPPEQAVESLRGYGLGVASSFLNGFYALGNGNGPGDQLQKDAAFYGSAGFPVKGPAVFSLKEVDEAYGRSTEKPVLIMQSYDPAVVPLLASGKLGGLVVTSPYMASHLKLLCETHMVSGLFGTVPAGEKTLSREFNEEAKPDLPPYFAAGEAAIDGRKVAHGQMVLVGAGGDGICLNPPDFIKTSAFDLSSVSENDKLSAEVRNLRLLNQCFAALFSQKGTAPHGVKSNVDSCDDDVLNYVQGVGLVRTEQIVATSHYYLDILKDVLLKGGDEQYARLFGGSEYTYRSIIAKLNDDIPVKIRLFDFVHHEILNKDEQKQFVDRYGKLDIHGGEALATWPRLYREQVRTIFKALKRADVYGDMPLEIMMPAVKSEKDVLDIKKIVDEEAKAADVGPKKYSFGVMAETLQACENISAIAKHVDFISFGTNDLTQEYFGISRSDLKAHANFAAKNGSDPFKKLAPEILDIMRAVVTRGREANPALKIDVCGAQAADPDTAVALYKAGIDNISVAPSLGNLFGLPVLLNYRAYDAMKAAPAPAAPGPAKPSP